MRYEITDLSLKRDRVVLTIEGKRYEVSLDFHLDNLFYPKKEIDEETFSSIKREEKNIKARSYLKRTLLTKRYTVKGITDKLKALYEIKEKDIFILLKPYIESGILDDRRYAIDLQESLQEKGYSNRYIREQLSNRGVSPSLLEEIDDLDDEKTLLAYLKEEIKRTSDMTYQKKKEKLYQKALSRGFGRDLILSSLDTGLSKDISKDEKERDRMLNNTAIRCYNNVVRRNISADKRKESFVNKLMREGFTYYEIKEWINREEKTFDD